MSTAKEFYKQQSEIYKANRKRIRKQLLGISLARLLAFILIVTSVFYFLDHPLYILLTGVPLLVLFLWLLGWYGKKKAAERYALQRIKINELELKALEGDYSAFATGEKHRDALHAYSEDIDLFGVRSFFQFLNRTQTQEGEAYLAKLLKANNTDEVVAKQEVVKELAEKSEWRQNFMTTASLIDSEVTVAALISWFANYEKFTKSYFKWLPKLFALVSMVIIVLFAQEIVGVYLFVGWLIFGFVFTTRFQKGVGELSDKLSKNHELLAYYAQLLEQIEQADFTSDILKEKQSILQQDKNVTASKEIAILARRLQNLEHGSNLIVKVFGNGWFLYDLWMSYPVEQWINQNASRVEAWLEVTDYFEAQNSLSNFAYNHPEYTYPKIADKEITFKAKSLCHPLLLQKEAVPSDVEIGNAEFLIITGANMAGKSTFLRSVSLAILMANIGLPIRADEVMYQPIPLLTSMRTTDSLEEETSYFFAELKRLRFIVDNLENRKCFVILDEILKGTNSTDKANGSIRFIKKLVAMHATGMVATHDLSLCAIADEMPQVKNYFFDTQIKDDELYFDYRLKPGICSDRNATFLLEKMKIVD